MKLKCRECGKTPSELKEFVDAWKEDPKTFKSPEDYVMRREGTYNPNTKLFICSSCYILSGKPFGNA